jgi:ubiquinone biosynthesis monooxygenase Coq7
MVGRNLASAAYTHSQQKGNPAITTTPHNLTPQQREALDSALRVDQAGEVAANWIYKGQLFILGRDPSAGRLIQVYVS